MLIAVGAIIRIVSYCFSANSGGDAAAHLSFAGEWLQHVHPKVMFGSYPPGHFWLIGLSSLVIRNISTAGRVLSLVLGIASLPVFLKLARALYGDSAALLSLAIFCLYSIHIAYSTTSSAEVSYLFFTLLGIAYFFSYFETGSAKLWYLAISGLSLSLGEAIRYEAWVVFAGLGPILAVLSLGRANGKNRLYPLLVFGATGGAWPAFMMSYSWYYFHSPFYQVSLNRISVTKSLEVVSRAHQLMLTPGVLLLTLTPFLIVAAIWGLATSFSSRLPGAFAVLVLFFLAVEAYEIASGGLLSTARYTITLGTMLAVVAGYGAQKMFQKFSPVRTRLAIPSLVCLLALNLLALLLLSEVPNRYAESFASISPRLRYQHRVSEVAEYLRNHLAPNDAVVIDNYNVESNVVADAAGLPIVPGKRAFLASRKNDITVREYISRERPRYLVYSDQGTLRDWFDISPGCTGVQHIDGITLHCAFANNVYRIYVLSYD